MAKDFFKSPDYYAIDKLLSEENILIRSITRDWVKTNVSPIIESAVQNDEFPVKFVKGISEIGGFGPFLPEKYGGAEIDLMSYGLMMQELERGDSSLRVLSSIQSGLVMKLIFDYGSEQQKLNYLLPLSRGEMVGSFGMSEPNHGSDPSSMLTRFSKSGNKFIINGSKLWIGQAPICNVAVFWCKNNQRLFGFAMYLPP